jgi:hypothetical protein
MKPIEKWNLTEVARVTVDDCEIVVVDDGSFRTAMFADRFDAETEVEDYSEWCSGEGSGIGDEDLCARIAAAADLDGIYSAGSCTWVEATS